MTTPELDNLEYLLRKLIVLKGDAEYYALALWIVHCHAIPEFDFAPRLGIWSPEKRCGKSLLLEIIANLLPNARTTSSISVAALFRLIEKDESIVILIDESDATFGRNGDREKAEALRQIIDAGFKRGQVVTRCEGRSFEPKDFHIFCPVALAGIGTSAIPETIADRSILIEMRRKNANQEITEFESDEIETLFSPVRNQVSQWVERHRHEFRRSRPKIPSELNSRARDLWKPLFKIAESAGDVWQEKARLASIALSSGEAEAEDISLPLRLLFDIRSVFNSATMPTKDLIFRLQQLEESPWPFMDKFNSHLLAKMLRGYGIRPVSFRSVRGYQKSDFDDAWQRYLAPLGTVTTVTTTTQDLNPWENQPLVG